MIRVIGLDHINIRVADLDRALEFYTGALGLHVVQRNRRRDGTAGLVALRAGGSIIFLQPSPGYKPVGHDASGLDHYSLEIEKFESPDAFKAHLQEKHVDIVEGPVKRFAAHGDGTSIYVRDPDGHRIELKQYDLG